ncbi:MAG: acyl-CoA carboxylase subunit beta [Acidobacteria bacterium]|nr:MAG: acyl-CoA carboxylase subunit beta [Acidobacteriota bacterium]REK01775.1 MAG: acyl-CoA carboxylase subunit beta [Acidobacteriota bacterium]REK14731.1 MAG: acyl-CoA carboxylase subunit beta [Acidobacteriota bacterium]REK45446.1 MAG: acyl-CoA carboxylase subunit beta [Acidobacteriota bacterium]
MTADQKRLRLEELTEEFRSIEERLRLGGGLEKIERIHSKGKLTARERIELLFDEGAYSQEIGLFVAYDEYDGKAPAAAVVTSLGRIHGRECVVVANDATIKAGAWYPETIKKILRAQEIAMRCRIPIIYLVDSAGVNLPYQGGVFPGQYGAARIFYYNSIMRKYLKVPQISAVMGMCVAGGAYLPALSDVILMVEGTSFMGLGGANLVKGATGQTIDNETLGGAMTHNAVSGVAHFRTENEKSCIEKIRQLVSELPPVEGSNVSVVEPKDAELPAEKLYEILPDDHRQPYEVREVLKCILDEGELDEFQADFAKEMICGTARIRGIHTGIIANHRGMIPQEEAPPKIGGIVYTESAEKTAYFIENCNRHGTPILFVQDVSGFMIGADAEHSGIIRAGARFVEAMASATVPKLVLTLNHASGAGYYAMAGQGFDPDFIFSLPTGRMGVMEGDSAVQAIFGTLLDKLKKEGLEPDQDILDEMEKVRATYEKELDAKYAAARGFVDAIVAPEDLRDALEIGLRAGLSTNKPHLGPFVLPSLR